MTTRTPAELLAAQQAAGDALAADATLFLRGEIMAEQLAASAAGWQTWRWDATGEQVMSDGAHGADPVAEAETSIRWLLSGHPDAKAAAQAWLAAYAHD